MQTQKRIVCYNTADVRIHPSHHRAQIIIEKGKTFIQTMGDINVEVQATLSDISDTINYCELQERIANLTADTCKLVNVQALLGNNTDQRMVYIVTENITFPLDSVTKIFTIFNGVWFDSSIVNVSDMDQYRYVHYASKQAENNFVCSGDIETTNGTKTHIYDIPRDKDGVYVFCVSGYGKKLHTYKDARPNVILLVNNEYHCIPVALDYVSVGDASMCSLVTFTVSNGLVTFVRPDVPWRGDKEVSACTADYYQREWKEHPMIRDISCMEHIITTKNNIDDEKVQVDIDASINMLNTIKCSLFAEDICLHVLRDQFPVDEHVGIIGRGFRVQQLKDVDTSSCSTLWYSPFVRQYNGTIALLRRPSLFRPVECLSDDRVCIIFVGTENPSNIPASTEVPVDPVVVIVSKDPLDKVMLKNARLYAGPLSTIVVYQNNTYLFHSGIQRFVTFKRAGDIIPHFLEQCSTMVKHTHTHAVVNPSTWIPLFQNKSLSMTQALSMFKSASLDYIYNNTCDILQYLDQLSLTKTESEIGSFRMEMIQILHNKIESVNTLRPLIQKKYTYVQDKNVEELKRMEIIIAEKKGRITKSKKKLSIIIDTLLHTFAGVSNTHRENSLKQAKRNQDIRQNVTDAYNMTPDKFETLIDTYAALGLVFLTNDDLYHQMYQQSMNDSMVCDAIIWDRRTPQLDTLDMVCLLTSDQYKEHKFGTQDFSLTMPASHMDLTGPSWIVVPVWKDVHLTQISNWAEEANTERAAIVRILMRKWIAENNSNRNNPLQATNVRITYTLICLYVRMLNELVKTNPTTITVELSEKLASLWYMLLTTLASGSVPFSPLYTLFTNGPVKLAYKPKDDVYNTFNNKILLRWISGSMLPYFPVTVQCRVKEQLKKYILLVFQKTITNSIIETLCTLKKKQKRTVTQQERITFYNTVLLPLEGKLVHGIMEGDKHVKKIAIQLRDGVPMTVSDGMSILIVRKSKYTRRIVAHVLQDKKVPLYLLTAWIRKYENPLQLLKRDIFLSTTTVDTNTVKHQLDKIRTDDTAYANFNTVSNKHRPFKKYDYHITSLLTYLETYNKNVLFNNDHPSETCIPYQLHQIAPFVSVNTTTTYSDKNTLTNTTKKRSSILSIEHILSHCNTTSKNVQIILKCSQQDNSVMIDIVDIVNDYIDEQTLYTIGNILYGTKERFINWTQYIIPSIIL
jgi:hypothetical protein